jgi:Uma2 family endonuclease
MNAVWLEIPESFLEERHRLGHDQRDELWEGVLHMVPPARPRHGVLAYDLLTAIKPIGARLGLRSFPDGAGIYAPDIDPLSWRIPDGSLARPEQESDRGLEGAVLCFEIRSPDDDSYRKLPFYARVGLEEVWIVHPASRAIEIYHRVNDELVLLAPIAGVHRSPVLGITFETIAGPVLRLRDGELVSDL